MYHKIKCINKINNDFYDSNHLCHKNDLSFKGVNFHFEQPKM